MDKRDMSYNKRYIVGTRDVLAVGRKKKKYRSMRHVAKENRNGNESSRTGSVRKRCQWR